MVQFLRRLVLLVCLILSTTLSLWTPGPLIRVSVTPGPAGSAIDTQDPQFQQLAAALQNVANHSSKDPSLRSRLAQGQIDLLDSTLAFEPSRFDFFFAPQESPWNQIAGQLPPDRSTIIQVRTPAAPCFLRATLCTRPRDMEAPEHLVYPWASSSLPGWLALIGIGAYLFGRYAIRQKDIVDLDPRFIFLQTTLGVLMAWGFWSMALLRSNPSPQLFTHPGWGNILALAGALGGVLILFSSAARASRRLEIREDHVVVAAFGRRLSIFPAQVTGLLKDRARRVFVVSHGADRPLLIPIRHHAAARAARLLGGESPTPPAEPALQPRGLLSWAFQRVVPALILALALGALVGALRAGTAFMAGLQGMFAGLAVGAIAGYWARWDHPQDYGRTRQFAAALLAVAAFTLGQFAGISLAMKTGTGWDWLCAMLSGQAHEEILGYSRYRWSIADIRPGPAGWIFFNILDVVFLFVFTWLLLGVNLAREPRGSDPDSK